ncbi:hypothetical protein CYY_007135 [Polysphondylium violaceum]|uniref:WD40 repeat-containing protein n=1 Tax=Polysphondylium violaceum TaxID=133409 RepID=A0A8J4UR31_9MYCE|nr:hypothetical protein CYY_007135 [Polysphondylium violaceum]
MTINITESFGVGSSRYISCLAYSDGIVDNRVQLLNDALDQSNTLTTDIDLINTLTVPIGGGIVHWNVKTQQRSLAPNLYTPLHSDAITCLIRSPPIPQEIHKLESSSLFFTKYFHISASYSGEIGIWDYNWNLVGKYQMDASKNIKIMHISLDQSFESFPLMRLAVSDEHGNCNITILDVDLLATPNLKFNIFNTLNGNVYFFGEMVDSKHIVVVQQDVGKKGFQDERTFIVGEGIANLIKINCETGQLVDTKTIKGFSAECGVIVKNQNYYQNADYRELALSMGRTVYILNADSFQLSSISCQGSGLMKDLIFYENNVIVPCSNPDLIHYDTKTNKELNRYKGTHGVAYSLKWAIPGKRLWVFDEAGIHSIYLNNELNNCDNDKETDKVNYSLLYHQISCCGVDFNFDGTKVACGDFLGNVITWSIGENKYEPLNQYFFGIPVRALSWSSGDDDYILVGLMDGSLINWNRITNETTLISNLQDGITCIQWEKKENPTIVAVGTTGGHLNVYQKNKDNDGTFHLEWSILAHQPSTGPQDLRFGSINKFAEIWSLTFHPTNSSIIATCSEDQTTIIWNKSINEKVKVLTGHTTAVTCIDWQVTAKHGMILATCADDQTVRIWNTDNDYDNWKEILVFNTTDMVGEWHTVTYLSLINDNHSTPKVVCVTQNGWIFVWDIISKQKIYSKRVHLGSIEGLKFNFKSKKLVSCSSDCLVHIYNYNNDE